MSFSCARQPTAHPVQIRWLRWACGGPVVQGVLAACSEWLYTPQVYCCAARTGGTFNGTSVVKRRTHATTTQPVDLPHSHILLYNSPSKPAPPPIPAPRQAVFCQLQPAHISQTSKQVSTMWVHLRLHVHDKVSLATVRLGYGRQSIVCSKGDKCRAWATSWRESQGRTIEHV